MYEIIHELQINGQSTDIYNALTTKDGLKSWWTNDVETDEKIGSVSEFGFYGHKAIHHMKIVDQKPSSKVDWKCEESPIEEWNNTQIKFEIKESSNGVHLKFIQSGFTSKDMGFGMFNYGWSQYLTSLKDYIETGKGRPNTT